MPNSKKSKSHKCYVFNSVAKNETCQTASKYNGGPNDIHKFIIGLDWLQVHMYGDPGFYEEEDDIILGDFSFCFDGMGTRHYKSKYKLYHKGEYFALLQMFPRSTEVLQDKSVQLKVENSLFYDNTDLLSIFIKLEDQCNLRPVNISRLDVFMDFQNFDNGMTLEEFDKHLHEGKIISKTKVKDFNKYAEKEVSGYVLNGLTFGSRQSPRYLRIYNKSKEIERSGKQIIKDLHNANNLTDTVYRFEYQLKNEFLKQINNFEFEDVFTKEGQFELLDQARKGHFEFVWDDHNKRNDRKKPVQLFDWDAKRNLPEFIFDYEKTGKKPLSTTASARMKNTVRGLIQHYILGRQGYETLKQLCEIVHEYDLKEWYDRNEERYILQFLKDRSILYDFDFVAYETQKINHFNKYRSIRDIEFGDREHLLSTAREKWWKAREFMLKFQEEIKKEDMWRLRVM